MIGHTDWGAHRTVLLRSLPVFGSFQSGLRFHCLWVGFKVTPKTIGSDPPSRSSYSVGRFPYIPVQSLYVEAHEPSLSYRRLKLSLNDVIKLNYCPYNPAYSCVFEPQNTKLFEKSQFVTPPLGLRMLPHLVSSGLV